MAQALIPHTAAEVAEIVRDARAAARTLEVAGTGTRRGLGLPVEADALLDLSRLSGVVDYDPAELVLTARPATPMREIAALLAGSGQHLAFDPPDLAPLWGGEAGGGTLGGALSCGLGGPRRIAGGAPRDHFLGFSAVNGLGEAFVAGGKVIKNVTGYDLPKLMAGAFGTLAVLTEVTVKVLPAPPAETTLVLRGLDTARAIAAMAAALGSPAAVSAAAHLPDGGAGVGDGAVTLVRIDGVPVSVEARATHLAAMLGDAARIDGAQSAALWHAIGAVHPFARPGEQVWRISLPASRAAAFLARLSIPARVVMDWGGALLWLFVAPADDAHAPAVRAALAAASPGDGHAMLVRADVPARLAAPAMQPLETGLAALSARVKDRFDPDGVLNPGRLLREI